MPHIYWDLEQGSGDWYRLRSTIPTSSRFSDVMTPKTMKPAAARKRYACEIIASRLMRWQADSLEKIEHIEAGKAGEPIAIAQLELIREIDCKKLGFVKSTDLRFGASPDRVVMAGDTIQITIEAKVPTVPIQMTYLLEAELAAMEPKTDASEPYKCQRQGHLLVCEAEEAIFYSYNPRMPAVYTRDHRDEAFIRKLADCLERFHDEVEELELVARKKGAFQAFADILTPAEIAAPTDADVQAALEADYAYGG